MGQRQEVNKAVLAEILEKVIGEIEDWVIIGDKYGKIIYANQTVYLACNSDKDKVLGDDMCMFVGVDLSDDVTLQHIQNFIYNGERFEFVTNRFVKGNKRIYLANTLTTIWDEKGLEYYVCLSKDITNTEQLKEEVYKANYFDPLTHYPNQKVFIESTLKQVKKSKSNHTQFAVIIIDIKGVGEINNVYGMNIGDRIIKEVGKRIKEHLNNHQEIFKYSGNSFAIIQQEISSEQQVAEFLQLLQIAMEEPIKIHNSSMYVEFRAGVSLYTDSSLLGYQVIEQAQIALAKAKKELGYTTYTFYTKGIQEEVKNSFFFEKELQLAVQNDEFIVYYQPFVELASENLVGMEALLRRKKRNGEIVSPASFIGALEKMNLIEKVGMKVLDKVCHQLKEWIERGYNVVPVSVNLSALQFKNPHLAKNIKKVLESYGIPPRYIVLEITETMVMEDIGIAQLIIEELKNYGFAISIDDFGTGYASIGYLKKFMFDHLKIDISFIREIVENAEDRAIVEAIIAIAKTFNLHTIAEGIESEEQLYVMSTLGCEMGQGFFWDRPITAQQIENKYLKVCL